MKKLLLSTFLGLFFCLTTFGQLHHKVTAYVFIGVPVFKKAGAIQGENIFYGYSKLPYFGGGINYNLSHKFSIGANLKQLITSKPNYNIANTNLGLGVKYNVIPMDKKISPFIYAEVNGGYLSVSQKANNATEYPQAQNTDHVKYIQQVRKYPEIRTPITCFGAMVGAGIDFTVKLKYGIFVSANYMVTNAHKNFVTVQTFEDNTSKFNFLLFQTGVRFSFGKSQSLY